VTATTVASRLLEWAEDNDADYIFGLAGNAALDALVAETADYLRFHHAMSSKAKLRSFASFTYQAGSWKRPRKVVARLECSLQPVTGEPAKLRALQLTPEMPQAVNLRQRLVALCTRRREQRIDVHRKLRCGFAHTRY
jgi:Transposase DDE domain group 1